MNWRALIGREGSMTLISHIKRWRALRALARDVEKRRQSFAVQDFTRRRKAMLKVTRG